MTEIICKHCGLQWETKSQYKLVSCPSCGNKTRNTNLIGKVNKEETIITVGGKDIKVKNKIHPDEVYQAVIVGDGKKGASIKAKLKHLGRKATIIVDKKNSLELSDEEAKKLAEYWDEHSY